MRQLNNCIIALLTTLLLDCASASTPDSITVPAWAQVEKGMTKEQVYAALGTPLRETERTAQYKSAETKTGWDLQRTWRMLNVYFDAAGRVKTTRQYQQHSWSLLPFISLVAFGLLLLWPLRRACRGTR